MGRTSFVFYQSFYDAISELEPEQQAEAYKAICEYAFNGKEPECKGVIRAVFKLVKPQIDANNKRRENGKLGAEHGQKGGRPKKENGEETPKERQENPMETPNVNVNANVNVNVNDNDNDNVNSVIVSDKPKQSKHKHGEYKHVLLTDQEYDRLVNDFGESRTVKAIRFFDEYIEEKGNYKAKSHYLAMRRWVFDAIEKTARSGTQGLPYSGIEF